MNSSLQGSLAETQAADYLVRKGHKLIARNFRAVGGEIDLVTLENKTLVFVEVKQRQNLDSAAYAITSKQQQRLIRGAECFIRNNQKYQGFDLRFDAILITLPFQIRHIKNAWTA